MATSHDAINDGENDYGTFFRVEGDLMGPSGCSLRTILIWLQWRLDGTFHFFTLKPLK